MEPHSETYCFQNDFINWVIPTSILIWKNGRQTECFRRIWSKRTVSRLLKSRIPSKRAIFKGRRNYFQMTEKHSDSHVEQSVCLEKQNKTCLYVYNSNNFTKLVISQVFHIAVHYFSRIAPRSVTESNWIQNVHFPLVLSVITPSIRKKLDIGNSTFWNVVSRFRA